jgi:DNA-binding transcriptional regulator/RsmH inhibitor MraZ
MKLAIFSGTSEHTIDAKNRLAVPKKFRERIDPEVEVAGLYVVPGRPSSYLWLYTERRFEQLSNEWSSDLIPDSERLSGSRSSSQRRSLWSSTGRAARCCPTD